MLKKKPRPIVKALGRYVSITIFKEKRDILEKHVVEFNSCKYNRFITMNEYPVFNMPGNGFSKNPSFHMTASSL